LTQGVPSNVKSLLKAELPVVDRSGATPGAEKVSSASKPAKSCFEPRRAALAMPRAVS